jgi:hypothetical protein
MPYTSGLMRPAVIVYIDASVLSLASGLVLHVRVKSQRGASPVPNVTERASDRRAKSRIRRHWSVMGRTRVRGSKLRYERASGGCNDVTRSMCFSVEVTYVVVYHRGAQKRKAIGRPAQISWI